MPWSSIDDITSDDIKSLVDDEVPESTTLDFKSQLPDTPKGKKNLCVDIASLANTRGGYIVFGVEESGGVATALPGLIVPDRDKVVLQLDGIARTGIAPPVAGIAWRWVDVDEHGPVLVCHAPRSWIAPHMVEPTSSRFYGRGAAGNYVMDYHEIRRRFLGAADLSERIRHWVGARAMAVDSKEWAASRTSVRLLLHVIPIAGFLGEVAMPVADVEEEGSDCWKALLPISCANCHNRFNLAGVRYYATDGVGKETSYTQLYRNGIIEKASALHPGSTGGTDNSRSVNKIYAHLPLEICAHVSRGLALLDCFEVGPPYSIHLTLLNASGAHLEIPGYFGEPVSEHALDDDLVFLPEVLLDSMIPGASLGAQRVQQVPRALAEALRPIFDALWQGGGLPNCPMIDDILEHSKL